MHERFFALHALFCALLAASTLSVDLCRYKATQMLLSCGRHTVYGLVTDKRTWQKTERGCIITVSITHIDYLQTTGICKFFVYSNQAVAVGTHYAFFGITLSESNTKPELVGYALREHMLGAQFCPFLRTKKLPITSFYGAWLSYWHSWRNALYEQLEKKLNPQSFTYVSALFFGNKNRSDFLDMRTKFTRWGLTHYLARSGLHISLLVSLWVQVLRIIPIGISAKALLLFLVLCLYDQLSWANISFNRALWLWFFYLGSWLTAARATPLFGFAQLTLLILLTNPWYASCLDFQLSFFLTGILMVYSYYHTQEFLLSYCTSKNK